MKHFIAFQKEKGLFITVGTSVGNDSLVNQINHELMSVGYVMTKDLHQILCTQDSDVLQEVYSDLVSGIREVVGGSGYEPIYRNFPQSVLAMSYTEFLVNAIFHYWSFGTWRPEDSEYIKREFKLEAVNYKPVGLISESKFNSIFENILYSGTSISKFDKACLDYFIDNGGVPSLSKISFKETLAYVGKRLLDNPNITFLSTKNATDVLRLLAAYSGGDEGLKENTKFLKPNNRQARLLRNTLDNCYNLEDSFKTYREIWLRVLFYLNPMHVKNKKNYPNLYHFSIMLRNEPKALETFNAKIERLITEVNTDIFALLAKRQGVFTRRLDHLVRVFGEQAVVEYINSNPSFMSLVTAYNHFSGREKTDTGRGAILANQNKSSLVTYAALEALDGKLVKSILAKLYTAIEKFTSKDLADKKVFIDRCMYYTPLAMNNRASSLSLSSNALGTSVPYTGKKTIRMYVHWEGRSDIDLSGMVIMNDNIIHKIGWNSGHHFGDAIVYSGDNTGYADKNAEYIDINVGKLPADVEWVILDANIYRGPNSNNWSYNRHNSAAFADYNGTCHAGWMTVDHPTANNLWQPQTLENAVVLNNTGSNAYLMAFHVPSKNVVYLDMENSNSSNVTNAQDAREMRMFLDKFVTVDDGKEINWDKLNQGHVLRLIASNLVMDSTEADIVFDRETNLEEVSRIINAV